MTTNSQDCSGCRCCPNGACEPDEPLGPGVCGHTCPCHPDFWREMYDEHFPGEPGLDAGPEP